MIPLHQLTRSALRVTLHSLVLWNTSSSPSELPMKETMMMEATVLKRIATNPAEKLESYELLFKTNSHTPDMISKGFLILRSFNWSWNLSDFVHRHH